MRKVLVACTIESISTILETRLEACEVRTCTTGSETIAQLNLWQPDLLVLDLILYETDGFSVLRRATFSPRYIIVLTSLITVNIINSAIELGVQEMISIPCSIPYLIKTIEKYI